MTTDQKPSSVRVDEIRQEAERLLSTYDGSPCNMTARRLSNKSLPLLRALLTQVHESERTITDARGLLTQAHERLTVMEIAVGVAGREAQFQTERAEAAESRVQEQQQEITRLTEARDALKAEIGTVGAEREAVWQSIEHGYDIEPRAYFEKEASRNGFRFPLAQAFHHIWKREPKVDAIQSQLTALQSSLKEIIQRWNDSAKEQNKYAAGQTWEQGFATRGRADVLEECASQLSTLLDQIDQAKTGQTARDEQRGAMNERLQVFLYILLRDHLPSGQVESIMADHVNARPRDLVPASSRPYPSGPQRFSNPHLAAYAGDLAARLTQG